MSIATIQWILFSAFCLFLMIGGWIGRKREHKEKDPRVFDDLPERPYILRWPGFEYWMENTLKHMECKHGKLDWENECMECRQPEEELPVQSKPKMKTVEQIRDLQEKYMKRATKLNEVHEGDSRPNPYPGLADILMDRVYILEWVLSGDDWAQAAALAAIEKDND
jgi:hypothetical protein